MAQRFGQLLTIGGVALFGLSSCIYVVDPGEKALIMNNITGLRQKVYNQGYNFKIPLI
jgi:regulator of protease activity HflC (stomatin/prohibitin superfamily)